MGVSGPAVATHLVSSGTVPQPAEAVSRNNEMETDPAECRRHVADQYWRIARSTEYNLPEASSSARDAAEPRFPSYSALPPLEENLARLCQRAGFPTDIEIGDLLVAADRRPVATKSYDMYAPYGRYIKTMEASQT